MNKGIKFSEELSLDELQEIAESVVDKEVYEKIKAQVLETGNVPTEQDREQMIKLLKADFLKKGKRQFFGTIKDELKNIPISVFINIKSKQKDMAKAADSITNIIREVIRNPQAFSSIAGIGKATNELLENSGLSPIDFTQITKPPDQVAVPSPLTPASVGAEQVIN